MSNSMIGIIALIVVIAAVVVWMIILESRGYVVNKYEVTVNKKLDHDMHFVMISDLHDTDHGNNNEVLLEEIRKINPEFVIFAGDIVTAYMEYKYDFEPTLEFIGRLAKEYKIYYGYGNHEMRYRDNVEKFPEKFKRLDDFLKSVGAPLLDDEKVAVDGNNADVYGVVIPHEYYRHFVTKKLPDDYLEKLLGKPDSERVSLLIGHNPDHFESYAKWGADVVLSGHVHGGIVSLPLLGGVISPQLKLFPKYDAGLFKIKDSTMILSRGLGYHTVSVRLNNKAEICDVYVRSKEENYEKTIC